MCFGRVPTNPLQWLSLRREGMRDRMSAEPQTWLEGTVGKEPTQMACRSEEFGFGPGGNGEPQKACKRNSALRKSAFYREHPNYG